MFLLRKKLRQLSPIWLAVVAIVALGATVAAGSWLWSWRQLSQQYDEAKKALESHQLKEAEKLLLQVAESKPNDAEVFVYLARAARRMDDIRKARDYLAVAEKIGGLEPLVELEHDLIQVQLGAGRDAENHLAYWAEKDDAHSTVILEALGKGYIKRFSLGQAAGCFKSIVDKDPGHFPAWILLGQVFKEMRNPEALLCYETALTFLPEHDEMRLRLAQMLLDQRKPDEALVHLEKLRARKRGSAELTLAFARVHMEQGDLEKARETLDQAGEALEGTPAGAELRGKLELDQENHAKAEPWFRRTLKLDPSNRVAMHGLEQCLRAQHKDKDKREEADKWHDRLRRLDGFITQLKTLYPAVSAEPDRTDLRVQLGEVLLQMEGSEREGVYWLGSVLEREPTNQAAHRLLAKYYRDKGEHQRADAHERALQK